MAQINQDIRYAPYDPRRTDNPEGFHSAIKKLSNSEGFLTGNGAPVDLLEPYQVYLDVLSGEWYRLENGVNQSFFSNSAGQTGSVLVSGTNIEVLTDTPIVGQTTINNTQSLFEGQGIALNRPPAPSGDVTIENTGLVGVVDVGLPAYGSIAERSQPTGTADINIKKFGSGSNIVLTNDANGVLVATSDTPDFVRVDTGGGSQGANAYTATTGGNNAGWYHSAPAGFSRYTICINNSDLAFFNQSNFVTNMTGGNWINSVDNNINLGSVSQRFIAVYATNGTIQTSDERMKKEITPLSVGLNMITQITPVKYKWNDDAGGTHNRTHWGYSAQQVKGVMDNLNISTADCDLIDNDALKNPDDPEALDQYAIRKSALQPILVNAIKEQQQIINSLLARVAVLESKHV